MARWLIGLAFILFLVVVGGMTQWALAAVDTVSESQGPRAWQGYPIVTNTPVPAYPIDKDTPTPTETTDPAKVALQVTASVTPPATLTSIPGAGATATLVPTRTSTLLFTPSPTARTATPTATVQPLPTLTVTPIRVTGLPVPGPGDRLPTTGGSLFTLLTGLLASGGLGGLLFVLGRVLKRRA